MSRLFIRSDAAPSMGAGHIMRCIALAQAWKKRVGPVTFITHCPSLQINRRIESEGFSLVQMEKISPFVEDIEKTLLTINAVITYDKDPSGDPIWVVLDGYHFTPDYQSAIIEAGFRLLVIDDYNHQERYNADIILNQNIRSHHFHYHCKPGTEKLLGTKYAMIRSEFLMKKITNPTLPDKAKHILITMGGSDPDNTTLKIVQAVNKIDDPGLDFKIVIGPGNSNINQLKTTSQTGHANIDLIDQANMPELMAWADLCLTAGGSTCWELCFLGVPFLIIVIAENQIESALGLAEKGAAINLGRKESLTPDDIKQCIMATARDLKKRWELIKSGSNLVDGKGTKRIIRQMVIGNIILRPADIHDAELLFEWANDKEVRSSSFNSEPIPWEEHLEWVRQKFKDENSYVFIAEKKNGKPVGQIRFDGWNSHYKISYSLSKKFRGLGLGKRLLKAGLKTIQARLQKPVIMEGFVKPDNIASKISFENCGFTPIENSATVENGSDHIAYQLQLNPIKPMEKS